MTREEEILAQIKARYERAKKENGSKVTCAVSRLSTPKERMERHQGFLAGLLTAEGICKDVIKTSVCNPWHKASEELPKMAHFTADGDYSDLCVCINESGEHKILVLCEQGDYAYWAYGYDGEDLYDEEMEGEIVKWMYVPEDKKED